MAAFAKALEMGAKSIEFDVQQTKDGRLAVIHDLDLKRVARDRRRVGELAWEELSRLDVGSWFDPRFAAERVPALEALIDLVASKDGGVELQLEVKQPSRPYPAIEERLLEALRGRPSPLPVVFSSFDHPTLHRLRALGPKARLGYLAGATRLSSAIREASELRCESVHLSRHQVDKKWVEAAKAAGMKVLVYTVNRASDLKVLGGLGVAAVFTNHPDLGEA